MADVFISYARSTFETARLLAQALQAHGFSIWFDEEIPANRVYADVISEQLDLAKAVLVIWSADAASSHWVRAEANRAREKGTLVQVRVDDARIPLPFDQIQCLDFRGWRGSRKAVTWKRLTDSLGQLAAADGLPSAPLQAKPADQGRGWSRRPLLLGLAGAVAAGAAGLIALRQSDEDRPLPGVELLMHKAQAFMQDARPEEISQATAYLLEAVRLAPGHAPAWGLLAFSYVLRKYIVPPGARPGEEARCRSAARTALDLDPDEPFASCSLAMLVPPYRNWQRSEQVGRELSRRFDVLPLSNSLLADALIEAGYWREGVKAYSRIDRSAYLIPLVDRSFVQALWSAGDLQRAESMLAEAAQRWPVHRAIWNLRVKFLTHTGRPDEAVRLLENRAEHPASYPEALLRSSLLTAKALAGTADRKDAIRANLEMVSDEQGDYLVYLNRKFSLGQLAAQRCAALGDADTAFSLLEGYYFGRGPWARLAPEAGDQDRSTANLFEPPMSGVWRDGRFSVLVDQIGLARHWRATARRPDFRRSV